MSRLSAVLGIIPKQPKKTIIAPPFAVPMHSQPPEYNKDSSERNNKDIDTLVKTRDYLYRNNPELNDDDIAAILKDLQEMQMKRKEFEMSQPRTVTLKAHDVK